MIVYIILAIILILFIPVPIATEIAYQWSRHKSYDKIDGFESIRLTTTDNLDIQAWYTAGNTNNKNSKVCLLVHGHNDQSKLIRQWYGPIFEQLGFDLFLIDMRNHGKSGDDKPIALGAKESLDVLAAAKWIVESNNWNKLLIFGTSMGAVATLLASVQLREQHNLPQAIILDSMFLRHIDVIKRNLRKHKVLNPWRYLVVNYLLKYRTSRKNFPNLKHKLSTLDIPILMLQGSRDIEAPPFILEEIKELQASSITTRVIEGAKHSRLFKHNQYTKEIHQFVTNRFD